MVDDRRDDGSADTLSKTADRQAIAIRRDLAVRLARAAGAMALEAFRDSERIIVAAKEFDDVSIATSSSFSPGRSSLHSPTTACRQALAS